MRHTAFKRTVMATALATATAIAGMAGQAQAIDVNNTDLVLALWGNNTEYLQDLGSQSSLFNGSTHTFTISPGTLTDVGGTNNVTFSIYGITYDSSFTGQSVAGGIVTPLTGLTDLQKSQIFPVNQFNNALNQIANLIGNPAGLSQTIASSDPSSFSKEFGTSNTLNGAFPVSTGGALGGMLNILSASMTQQQSNGQSPNGPLLSQLGFAVLSADGSTLTVNTGVAAVPVPAAVVLFGTGLIGLVGIARRSIQQYMA